VDGGDVDGFWAHLEELANLTVDSFDQDFVAEFKKLSITDDTVRANFRIHRPKPLSDCVLPDAQDMHHRSRSRSPRREVEVVIERTYWDGFAERFMGNSWPLMIQDSDQKGPPRLADIPSFLDGFADA